MFKVTIVNAETGQVIKDVQTPAIVAGVRIDGDGTDSIIVLHGSGNDGLNTCLAAVIAARDLVHKLTEIPELRSVFISKLAATLSMEVNHMFNVKITDLDTGEVTELDKVTAFIAGAVNASGGATSLCRIDNADFLSAAGAIIHASKASHALLKEQPELYIVLRLAAAADAELNAKGGESE